MKHFTEPNGIFVLKIPTEWQYRNVAAGDKEISPFSFVLYEKEIGAFQLSCYKYQGEINNNKVKVQKFNTNNLDFIESRMDGGGFNVHLWYTVVEDHAFIAKYIYDTSKIKSTKVKIELKKAEVALSSLELISPDKRDLALEIDKYEKFMASLSASFDLKNKAIKNLSIIELIIIIANQIDAYLRIGIVMKKQLKDQTNRIDIALLFQGEKDTPIMERKIYKQARELEIIDQIIYDELEKLYSQRNKVVHRYIISEFKTRDLYIVVKEYENISEKVRLSLKKIEELQFSVGIGIHGYRNPNNTPSDDDVNMLFSKVNDKHLIKKLNRKIKN